MQSSTFSNRMNAYARKSFVHSQWCFVFKCICKSEPPWVSVNFASIRVFSAWLICYRRASLIFDSRHEVCVSCNTFAQYTQSRIFAKRSSHGYACRAVVHARSIPSNDFCMNVQSLLRISVIFSGDIVRQIQFSCGLNVCLFVLFILYTMG